MVKLSEFANKNVYILCEGGSQFQGFLERHDCLYHSYRLSLGTEDFAEIAYTADGFRLGNKGPHPFNIKLIYLADKIPEYVKLEQKAQEMQKTLEALNAQVEETKLRESLEKRKESCKLPEFFNRRNAIRFLEDPFTEYIDNAFDWRSTPQGFLYWKRISGDVWWANQYSKEYKIPEVVRNQIMVWVIESYKQDFGY